MRLNLKLYESSLVLVSPMYNAPSDPLNRKIFIGHSARGSILLFQYCVGNICTITTILSIILYKKSIMPGAD